MRYSKLGSIFLYLLLLIPLLNNRAAATGVQIEEVAKGLGVPWAMTFIAPDQLVLTEREGQLKRLDLNNRSIQKITGLPAIHTAGQGGLLDVVYHVHQGEQWLYFTYSKPVEGLGATTLAKARLVDDQLLDWQDLLITRSATDTERHYGSRMAFDDAGHVFFSVGDRGVRPHGQNRLNHAGTIIRLNIDGSVPADNPFIDDPDSLPEIWSYGHRNPQGLAFDLQGRLWSIEHGPRGGDEINLIEPGSNYGWPVISYGKEYWGPLAVGEGTHRSGMEQPVKYYVPSIAPGSLLIYSGKTFSQWHGNLFAGALKLRHLNRVEINEAAQATHEERLLTELDERIRALAQSAEGWLYFSTDSGRIMRIVPQ